MASRSGGSSNQHAYRWLREARTVLGTALIYRDVLTSTLRAFEGAAVPKGQWSGLLRALLGCEDSGAVRGGLCPACVTQREAEDRYLEALLASLTADDDTQLAFDASQSLCYRHAAAAVRRAGPAAERVLEQTRRATLALIASLDEVIRKEDYRFRDEPRSEHERVAPASATRVGRGNRSADRRMSAPDTAARQAPGMPLPMYFTERVPATYGGSDCDRSTRRTLPDGEHVAAGQAQ